MHGWWWTVQAYCGISWSYSLLLRSVLFSSILIAFLALARSVWNIIRLVEFTDPFMTDYMTSLLCKAQNGFLFAKLKNPLRNRKILTTIWTASFNWATLITVDNHVTCGQSANRMLQRILMENQYILMFSRWVTAFVLCFLYTCVLKFPKRQMFLRTCYEKCLYQSRDVRKTCRWLIKHQIVAGYHRQLGKIIITCIKHL